MTLGLVPSSRSRSLGFACTLYAPTSPLLTQGGIAEILSPMAVEWAAEFLSFCVFQFLVDLRMSKTLGGKINQPFPDKVFREPFGHRVSNAALVLSSKNWKKYSRWGAASKNKSKKPWALCRRAGIDAALVRVQFVLRGCTHHRK